MNQIANVPSLLDRFGTPFERVESAVEHVRLGGGVLVVDDENRENEGDIIFAADTVTTEQMTQLIRDCVGIVCLTLTEDKIRALELPQMVTDNTCRMGTAFTVSIDAKEGVTTGVSAADRVETIRTAIADDCPPAALARPGHVFPLRANPGGVLARDGHTEASVELAVMAGYRPAGVICELMNDDGTMARLPEIVRYAETHGMPVVTIADIVAYQSCRTMAAD